MGSEVYDLVAIVTNDLNSDQRMVRICTTFSDHGKKVLLLGHQKKDSYELMKHNFHQKRIRTEFYKGPLFYLEYNLRILLLMFKVRAKKHYAVDLDTLLAVGIIHILKKTPFIFDAHELFSELPELKNKKIKKWIWSSLGRMFVPKAEKRYTVGSFLAEKLEKKYGVEFKTIYNYPLKFDLDFDTIDKNKRIILYQGKLNIKRGLEEMIEAMDHLEDCEFWIVGNGDIEEKVKRKASLSQSQSRIKLLGWKSPEELKKITPLASLGINLLQSDSQSYYYSAANKVFDYIMAGIPCLTMDFPEYKKLKEKHDVVYLIPDLDISSISNQIDLIFKNHELYHKKTENCLLARSNLNWEEECLKLFSVD